ncbi:hypothetical protein A3Q56_05173 [Intoshia linei]|uniref:Oligomycin sensitivity conferral protein n=1 Tax=Intoshia linei TaxID=1819745 RepID=A0A177AYI0_9BILA|nr:hypothetical protein A3Q56_05173 [Intoshia linei]
MHYIINRCPISIHSLNGKYAHALYSAALKRDELKKIENSLNTISNMLTQNKNIRDFIYNPCNKKSDKREALMRMNRESNLSETMKNFINIIANNGRFNCLLEISNVFKDILSAHNGEIKVLVTSARPLDSLETKELSFALQSYIKKGQILNIVSKIDSSLIGGLIIQIDNDRYIDLSTRRKINEYESVLNESLNL